MNLDRFRYYFRHNTSIQLLRSRHAPLILSFLHDQFKDTHRISIPQGELTRRLDDYRDALHRNDPTPFRAPPVSTFSAGATRSTTSPRSHSDRRVVAEPSGWPISTVVTSLRNSP